MDMREKIARALCKADGKNPDAPAWVRFPGAIPEGVCWRDQYADKADAVLDAMREPTPEMIEAAAAVEHPPYRDFAICVTGEWQAMIDAARPNT